MAKKQLWWDFVPTVCTRNKILKTPLSKHILFLILDQMYLLDANIMDTMRNYSNFHEFSSVTYTEFKHNVTKFSRSIQSTKKNKSAFLCH